MKKINFILLIITVAAALFICGCNENDAQQNKVDNSEEVVIDYGDAESFESALNEGKNLEGKIVRFSAGEFHPDSKLGYNVWAGEHLNFVSSRHPDIAEGDIVTVKIETIENLMGSWIIHYEKVDNAIISEDTITWQSETTDDSNASSSEVNADSDTLDNPIENTYEHNEYYDIIETASYKDRKYTIVIHKVLAKKDITISSDLLAYGSEGNVIAKDSDYITLTEGQYNFFVYSFETDISNATFKANFTAKEDSSMLGERNAVDMIQYNQVDNKLYITFKSNVDKLDFLAKYKLLYYKDNQIVAYEKKFFDLNLNGKDSTDVAEIRVPDTEYDRIEYIFEP